MLNTFFASVFTTECQDDLPTSPTIFQGSEQDKLSSYHISELHPFRSLVTSVFGHFDIFLKVQSDQRPN